MTNTATISQKIEHLLDQFEQRWIVGNNPPDLLEYCCEVQRDPDFPASMVWELAMVDLEFSWRRRHLSEPRGTAWYCQHLDEFGITEQETQDLAAHEMLVRSQWRQPPRIDELIEEQFPQADEATVAALRIRFRDQLDLHFPVRVVIRATDQPRVSLRLVTPCAVGRRRGGEPPAPCMYQPEGQSLHRLVVVDREANKVSRDQLELTRMGIHQFDLCAISDNVVTRAGDQMLPVGQSVSIPLRPLGLEIRFGGVILQLQRM